jgi:hypothetical protein
MKFVLVLTVCSFLTGECKEPIKYEQTFDSWKHCALTALDTSSKYLLAMDDNTVNEFKLSTQYTCSKEQLI